MDRPKGFIDTFSRPHLVKENEQANKTIRLIQEAIQGAQGQTGRMQRQLADMRVDGVSSLEAQTKLIGRITRNNASVDDMGRQIGKVQTLIEFNNNCIAYIDWLKGVPSGDSG